MAEERCEVTDLLRSGCAHCRGDVDITELADPHRRRLTDGDLGPVFTASYPGVCPCGERIRIGDSIRAKDGDYIHEDCT